MTIAATRIRFGQRQQGRIAGSNHLHFHIRKLMATDIFRPACGVVAAHDLADEPGRAGFGPATVRFCNLMLYQLRYLEPRAKRVSTSGTERGLTKPRIGAEAAPLESLRRLRRIESRLGGRFDVILTVGASTTGRRQAS